MANENENAQLLEVGKTYKLIIYSCGQTLTFTGKVSAVDRNFFHFIDKYHKSFTYNLNALVSLEEVGV